MSELKTVGDAWGDDISLERRAELKAWADKQREWAAQPEAKRGDRAFKDVQLTGADVYWLALESGRDEDGGARNLHLEGTDLGEAHLERAHLLAAHLERANLWEAHLEGAYLSGAHLEQAYLSYAHLGRADLSSAHLEGADLNHAHLEGTDLGEAHLERAHLWEAWLDGADLSETHLERANLRSAHLGRADLSSAHLEGAYLSGAHLEGADLTAAILDKASHLNGATLSGASLDQVTYDNVNLTVVDWSRVPMLGDELKAKQSRGKDGKPKDRATRRDEFVAAVRANRVLAVTLRSQGMNEDADRYAYRAQVLQRQVLWRQRKPFQALFSLFLDALATSRSAASSRTCSPFSASVSPTTALAKWSGRTSHPSGHLCSA